MSSFPAEAVVFSRDRPMQLAALLASMQEKVVPRIPVRILYRASTAAFERGYDLVFSMFTCLVPRREAGFRDDLLSILEEVRSSRMFFLVDDNLFTENVDLGSVTVGPVDTVVSLRLGRNTLTFPGGGGPTEQPRFDEHPDFPGMLAWKWGESKVGWAYPLSVDGHVFSTQEMRTLAASIGFSAPNSFEGNMQTFNEHFARRWGICFAKSALLNIPANRVQTEWENHAGDVSVEYLLNRWLDGDVIDHRQFYGFQNTSTHMLLDLPIVSRRQQVSHNRCDTVGGHRGERMNELKLRVYPPVSDGVADGLAVVLGGSYDIHGLEFSAPARILDIGGHVGSFSVWAASRWPGAQITTYEPHPESAAFCRLNTEGLSTVVERAVVGPGRPETLLLHEGIRNTGQRSIHMLGEQRSEGLMVKTLRARDLPPADIIKLDTEGCEIEIITDYQHMSGVQALMLEWHGLADYHALLKMMPSMGFRLVRDDTGGQYAGDRNLIFQRDKKLGLPPPSDVLTLLREEYDLESLPNLSAPQVLDVGSNVGGFLWYACQRWANVKALAFEPHPETFELLKSNTRNNLEIRCCQAAIVHPKTAETIRLYEGVNNREECSTRNDVSWPHVSQKLDTWVDVPTMDATELPPCDVLKVDTEGAEVDILTGFRHLSVVKVLLVEAHPVGGDLQGQIRRITEIAEAAGLRLAPSKRFGILRFVRDVVEPGITITGTVKDAPSAAASSVKSVRAQTHASFRHVLFALGDETMKAATKEADGDARIDVRAPVTPGAPLLANLLPVWRSLPDDEIIVWLDGDDELTPHALERVLDAHRKGAWVTYGQFSVDGRMGFAAPVGDNPRHEDWHATHLKTFRAGLVKQMRDEDFREVDGSYAGAVPDARVMFGVLELAGRERSVFIPDVLYFYNWSNAFFSRASAEELNQVAIEFERVRGFTSYARTDSLTPAVLKKEVRARYAVEGQTRVNRVAGRDMDLVQLFQKYGTDKLVNGYAPLYHTLLDSRREQVRSVLEVGIGTMIPGVHSSMVGYAGAGYSPGGSLRAWRDYFRNASVVGMDVQPDTQFSEERIQTVLCDSTDASAVQRAVGDKMFDFIVDDGSHVDVNQFSTLRNLYSRLRPGGFYVIEDIHPGNAVRDTPHLVGSIVGHNEYFFTGIRNNLCVIYAQPLTPYKREAW